jgi:hypothetical protein
VFDDPEMPAVNNNGLADNNDGYPPAANPMTQPDTGVAGYDYEYSHE